MSATEQQYDEIIAPMLLEVARKCEELWMALVARVEWGPEDSGITQINNDAASVAQRLTQIAAHSKGNIDALCMSLIRHFDVSQSVVLGHFNKNAQSPSTGEPG